MRRLLSTILLSLLAVYKYCVSPLLPSACRFYPSCSIYTRDAILKYGPFKGTWFGIKRVCRCHPYHPGGYDPVS